MMESGSILRSRLVFIDMGTNSQRYSEGGAIKPDCGSVPSPAAEASQPIKDEPVIPETPDETHRAPERRIRCPECKRYTAENEEKLLRHIRSVHRGENPFQCYMCDYSTYNKVRFEEHVRVHQGIKPYKCSHCPYRSVSKKNTQKHEKRHSNTNPLKCKDCGFLARSTSAFKRHMQTHEEVPPQKECHLCQANFDVEAYANHRKNRKRCKECNLLICPGRHIQHQMDHHGSKEKKTTKTILFTCAICQWEGNSKPRILLHLIHHPKQEVNEDVVDTSILRRLGIMGPRNDME